MNRRGVLALVLVGLTLLGPSLPGHAEGIRSVGLRLIVPFTGIPLSVGAEVVVNATFGAAAFSLFLSPAGGTLLLGSADVALTANPAEASAFLRITTGLSYFDPSRRLPTVLFGFGTSVLFSAAEPFLFGFTGELIYPVAFPVPMLTVSGGWAIP